MALFCNVNRRRFRSKGARQKDLRGVIRFKNKDYIGDSWRAISSEVAPILKPEIARIGS